MCYRCNVSSIRVNVFVHCDVAVCALLVTAIVHMLQRHCVILVCTYYVYFKISTNASTSSTGDAYCGTVGSEERKEYAVVGDIVNLSARLMKAVGDEIGVLCCSNTHIAAQSQVSTDT